MLFESKHRLSRTIPLIEIGQPFWFNHFGALKLAMPGKCGTHKSKGLKPNFPTLTTLNRQI
jgi:hypothetical protein